jgi:hypothetical protein
MGWWGDVFGGDAEKEAAERNRAALENYKKEAFGYLDKGFTGASGALDEAYQPLSALAQKYGAGTSLYLDALGVNGPEGNARATGAFQTAPGYDFQRDQALEAVNRRRAISGMWDSGNTDLDLLRTATGLADQSYNSWLSNLGGLVSPELTATQSGSAVKGSLADLYRADASDRVNVASGVTSGNMAANNYEAAGRATGARNLLGAGLSLANMVVGGGGGKGFSFGGSGTNFSDPTRLGTLY